MRLQGDPYDLDQMCDQGPQAGQVRAQLTTVARASQTDRQVAKTGDHVTELLHHLRRGRGGEEDDWLIGV